MTNFAQAQKPALRARAASLVGRVTPGPQVKGPISKSVDTGTLWRSQLVARQRGLQSTFGNSGAEPVLHTLLSASNSPQGGIPGHEGITVPPLDP